MRFALKQHDWLDYPTGEYWRAVNYQFYPIRSVPSVFGMAGLLIYKNSLCFVDWFLSVWVNQREDEVSQQYYEVALQMLEWIFRIVRR